MAPAGELGPAGPLFTFLRADHASARPNNSRLRRPSPTALIKSSRCGAYRMRALVIRAIDQQAANARRSHFSEGDFLLAVRFGHAAIEARSERAGNQSG